MRMAPQIRTWSVMAAIPLHIRASQEVTIGETCNRWHTHAYISDGVDEALSHGEGVSGVADHHTYDGR